MPKHLNIAQQIKNLFIITAIVCFLELICSFLPNKLGERLGSGICIFGGLLICLQIIVLCLLIRHNLLGRDKHA